MKMILVFVFVLIGTQLSAQDLKKDSASASVASAVSFDFQIDTLVGLARSLIGVPYCYGGMSPQGFDCSGFVNYVYSNFGFDLPRSSSELADFGREIPIDSCQKGDIILFAGSNAAKRPVGHAGIIVSEPDEPVQFIHSATSNKRGIIVTALDAFDYYKSRFVKVVRVLGMENGTYIAP